MKSQFNVKRLALVLTAIVILSFTVVGVSIFQAGGISSFNLHINPTKIGSIGAGGGETYVVDEKRSLELTDVQDLQIKTISADINVITVEAGETIEAHLHGEVTTNVEGAVPTLRTEKTGKELAIRTHRQVNQISGMYRSKVVLDIYLPADYDGDLQVSTVSGDGRMGVVQVDHFSYHTTSGKFKGEEIIGEKVTLGTTSGNVKIEKVQARDLQYKSVSGSLEVDAAQTHRADLKTTSGEIEVDKFMGELLAQTVSGDVKVNYTELSRDVAIKTTSGKVNLTLPKDASFHTDVKTTSGKIGIEFPVTFQGEMGKNNVKGTVGDGSDHQVNINTVSGNINIEAGK